MDDMIDGVVGLDTQKAIDYLRFSLHTSTDVGIQHVTAHRNTHFTQVEANSHDNVVIDSYC